MPKKFTSDEERKQYKRTKMAELRARKKGDSNSGSDYSDSQMQALAQFPPDLFERIIDHYQRWQRAINRCHVEMFRKRM